MLAFQRLGITEFDDGIWLLSFMHHAQRGYRFFTHGLIA
ncbi:hypothetical protein BQ8794_40074 [Mesorhizobium prunaredense]|uniref:Uncharacterized protein n=1 Tax=Mesorhizobium prunaredense TaxID=1631249 RepID=A0A1R3VF67_9HYPH|nr:hypothetical protein BQ8794_40074 [Mesorhizobium prunaredense]